MSHDDNAIPLTRPWLGDAEAQAAVRPLASGWVTQGPEVAAFEEEFAAYVGARHACAVSSCTTALHLALLAAGVRPGDEVITVSHSFIATANSIRYCGATPVFVDIQPGTFNIDPRLIERAIGVRTRAILCVHQLGMPCDLAAVVEMARRHGLPVIEDAACAIGSGIWWHGAWEKIGRPHGDVACFSFHPRKVITTGDGGMLTTSQADWDEKFRLWRQHGMSVPDTVRHGSKEVVFESYPVLGYNYRLTDIQAAIGREQLKRLPEIVARRRALAARYRELLADLPGLQLPEEPSSARSNWQSYCVRLPEGCSQRRLMQFLQDRGVASRRGVMCCHREPAYAGKPWPDCLEQSERAQDQTIVLPLFPQMTEADQARVVSTLRAACAAEPAKQQQPQRSRIRKNAGLAHPHSGKCSYRPLLTIVTPAYNESENLRLLYDQLSQVLGAGDVDWEWVVVDDHSADGSFAVLRQLADCDARVRGVRLARNAGSHTAITCGLHHARGDAAVIMAADLQDPPETLPALISKWREGAQIVWAVRAAREGEKSSTVGFARIYYLLMRRVIGIREMPATGADFFLMDRRVIDAFRQFNEAHVSILALITWMGFRQASITYTKRPRLHGRSGWTLRKKLKLLLDSVTSFSYLPIRLMTYVGSSVAILGLLYTSVVVVNALRGVTPPGWASLMAVVLVLGGLQMLMMGVLGEYQWRSLDESRRRPRYLIEETTEGTAPLTPIPLPRGERRRGEVTVRGSAA